MSKSFRSRWGPVLGGFFILAVFFAILLYRSFLHNKDTGQTQWHPPDTSLIPLSPEGEMIRYGRDLISNTAKYFGPKGSLDSLTNGMNCQNCHVEAGARIFGNNFAVVASSYPYYKDRSGKLESIEFKIKDCMERSLNGKSIDSGSKEMQAMVAYLKWVGKGVRKGLSLEGVGTIRVPFIARAADTGKGKDIYENKCQRCHGTNGEGLGLADSTGYVYPPLWGPHSFNTAAGIFRISRMAGFIKYNMPYVAISLPPQLSDEEAWDVAAFVNSQPRPEKQFPQDWPKPGTKPIDYPFGPYTDSFSERQHKYGPFMPIEESKRKKGKR